MRFDTVLLLDSSVPLAANLPAITRADQVIALATRIRVTPRRSSCRAIAHPEPTDEQLDSTFDEAAQQKT